MTVGYSFVIRKDDQVEPLGAMPLKGDADARLFAQDIIRDLMTSNAAHYEACTMDIFRGQRLAVSIPFNPTK